MLHDNPVATEPDVVPGLLPLGVLLGGLSLPLGLLLSGLTVQSLLPAANNGPSAYLAVDEVVAEPAKWEDRLIQVYGFVVPGSIKKLHADPETFLAFTLHNCGSEIEVRFPGVVPDVFGDGRELLVEGTLEDSMFLASRLSVKIPSYHYSPPPKPALTFCKPHHAPLVKVNHAP